MIPRDYYEDLGVFPDASSQTIKSAYRAKIFAAHPDRGGSKDEASLLNEAYSVLSNPEKRHIFDNENAQELNKKYGKAENKSYEELNSLEKVQFAKAISMALMFGSFNH